MADKQYDTPRVCIDVFTKYAAVVPVKGKTENDLALGMIESIVKMGHKPQVIYTDGETGIRNRGLFQKYFTGSKITVRYSRRHPTLAERFIGTFKSMLDKRIKPGQQWLGLIYSIVLTYNNKLVHSATDMTPKETTKPENELNAYVNLKLKAKHSRRYSHLAVGDKVHV